MDTWERAIKEALRSAPDWPGDPEALWESTAARLHRRPPWWRRPAVFGAAAAAAFAGAVALAVRLPPAPAAPAAPPALQAATAVIGSPISGAPVHFAVQVGTPAGQSVLIRSGRLEVRTPTGLLVWQAAIPELEARQVQGPAAVRAQVAWPAAGAPGHYRAELALAGEPGGGQEVGVGLTEFFIPFPAGQVRLGEVEVGQPQTRASVTAVLDRVLLTEAATLVRFHLSGDALVGPLEWTVQDASGALVPSLHAQYRQTSQGLEGEAEFEPTPAGARHLVLRLHRVGVLRADAQGGRIAQELPHTWEWDVNLDQA